MPLLTKFSKGNNVFGYLFTKYYFTLIFGTGISLLAAAAAAVSLAAAASVHDLDSAVCFVSVSLAELLEDLLSVETAGSLDLACSCWAELFLLASSPNLKVKCELFSRDLNSKGIRR